MTQRAHRRLGKSAAGPYAVEAFTLVEILAAVLLGSSVLFVAAYAAVRSLSLQSSVDQELVDRWERGYVLDQFEADLGSELIWLTDKTPTLRLQPEPGVLLEIVGLSDAAGNTAWSRRRLPARIAYVVTDTDHGSGQKRMLRRVRYLTDAIDSTIEQLLAENLGEVKLEQFDGRTWRQTMVTEDQRDSRPTAVRLVIRWADSPTKTVTKTVLLARSGSDEGFSGTTP